MYSKYIIVGTYNTHVNISVKYIIYTYLFLLQLNNNIFVFIIIIRNFNSKNTPTTKTAKNEYINFDIWVYLLFKSILYIHIIWFSILWFSTKHNYCPMIYILISRMVLYILNLIFMSYDLHLFVQKFKIYINNDTKQIIQWNEISVKNCSLLLRYLYLIYFLCNNTILYYSYLIIYFNQLIMNYLNCIGTILRIV